MTKPNDFKNDDGPDDWEDLPIKNEVDDGGPDDWEDLPKPKSKLESAISGTADMLTFGHSDEIAAGLRAGGSEFLDMFRGDTGSYGDKYDEALADQRAHKKLAEISNPKTYLGGQIAGGLVGAFSGPGAAAAKIAGGSFKGALGVGSAEGAIYGAGDSEANNAVDIAKDALKEAGVGALGGGLGYGAGKAISKTGQVLARNVLPKQAVGEVAEDIIQPHFAEQILTGTDMKPLTQTQGTEVTEAILREAQDASEPGWSELGEYLAKKLGKKTDNFIRKTVSLTGGVDDDAIKAYMKNRDIVNNARGLDEISADVISGVGKLKDKVIKGSEAAADLLDDSIKVKTTDLTDALESIKNKFNDGVTDESISAKNEISRWIKRLGGNKSKKVIGEPVNEFEEYFFKKNAPNSNLISLPDLKDHLKEIDRSIKLSDRAGTFASPAHQAKLQYRKYLDNILKEQSPEYAKAMEQVAKDASALQAASKQFGMLDATTSRLKSAGNRPLEKQEVVQALSGLDESLGTNLGKENEMRKIQSAFQQNMEGGRGPRNRAIGGVTGALMGLSGFGPAGGTAGAIAGAQLGSALDRHGGAMTKFVIDKFMDSGAKSIGTIIKETPERLGVWATPLMKAAERGPAAMGAAHYLLWKNNPDYRKLFTEDAHGVLAAGANKF